MGRTEYRDKGNPVRGVVTAAGSFVGWLVAVLLLHECGGRASGVVSTLLVGPLVTSTLIAMRTAMTGDLRLAIDGNGLHLPNLDKPIPWTEIVTSKPLTTAEKRFLLVTVVDPKRLVVFGVGGSATFDGDVLLVDLGKIAADEDGVAAEVNARARGKAKGGPTSVGRAKRSTPRSQPSAAPASDEAAPFFPPSSPKTPRDSER